MELMDKEKRYNTLDRYFKNIYGCKVAHVALNANLTCPNRDGKKGYGGCIYCSEALSGDFAGNKNEPLVIQFENIKSIMDKKWKNLKYIPYLQAGSNTYQSLDKLKELYEPLTKLNDIVGIDIATRADCFSNEIYEYLNDLNKRIPITIELGLQTSNEETGKFINRCITNKEFIDCVKMLRSININVVVHIINGLPYETETDMLNTIKFINNLDIQGVKIHSLLVLKNTKLSQIYEKDPFKIMTLEEYVDIVTKQIELLRDDIIIYRLAADAKASDLIEPKWTIKKLVVMNEIDKALRKMNTYQGSKYNKNAQ